MTQLALKITAWLLAGFLQCCSQSALRAVGDAAGARFGGSGGRLCERHSGTPYLCKPIVAVCHRSLAEFEI